MIVVSLPITAIFFGANERLLVALALAHVTLSGTFLLSEYAFLYGGGAGRVLLEFLELSTDTMNFRNFYESGGFRRWQSFSRFGGGMLMLIMILVPLRKLFTPMGIFVILPLIVCFIFMMTLGGHRASMLEILAIVGVCFIAQRMTSMGNLFAGAVVGVFVVALLYIFAPELPTAGQRAISVLPGIDISADAAQDAKSTMVGRRMLQARARRLIVQNFWIGRGLGVDLDYAAYHGVRSNSVDFLERMNRFYSGPIGIWVTCGVFAFTLFMIFLLTAVILAIRVLIRIRAVPEQRNFHRVASLFVGKLLWAALSYCFITGQAESAMKIFVPLVSVLMACDVVMRREARLLEAQKSTRSRVPAAVEANPVPLPV